MESILSKKRIIAHNGAQTNRFNRFKPWWTVELSELWEACRNSERAMKLA